MTFESVHGLPLFEPACAAFSFAQIFSDRSIAHTFKFPYYNYFKDAIEPLVNQVRLRMVRHAFGWMGMGAGGWA